MPAGLRRFALVVHVGTSVGLLGAVAVFFVLAMAGLLSRDPQIVRSAYIAINLAAEDVIVPLLVASLAIGVLCSLGTPWGLFEFYWVLAKLVVSLFALLVLGLQMDRIGFMARAAAGAADWAAPSFQNRFAPVLHSGGGLLVLLIPLALSYYKPKGLTKYGQRRRFEKSPAISAP